MRLFRFACLVLLCIAAVGAQTSARTFTVRGVVADQTGASIPDVTILLEGQGGLSLQTKSGVTGEFAFEGIAAGGYRITASRDEFKLGEQQLHVDEKLELPVRMALNLADLIQEVTVTGAAEAAVGTDPASNADSVRLDRDALDGLPIMDQDIVGTVSNLLDAGLLGAGGASQVVDGMETDEIGVSPSAIQEVRINNNPYSAEFSRPGRGRIEIITKQAASQYHGSFNFLIRDHRLDVRNAFAADKPHEQRREFEGHFTGPLGGSGKHSFLIGAERQEDDEQAVILAQTLTGLVQENVASPETENEFAVRFFRNASDKHAFSWSYERESEAADNQGIGGFTLPEAASSESEKDHDFQFRHNWFASPSVITQLTLQVARQTEFEAVAPLLGLAGVRLWDPGWQSLAPGSNLPCNLTVGPHEHRPFSVCEPEAVVVE